MANNTRPQLDDFQENLLAVMKTPEGRAVLWDIIDRTGLVAPGLFTGNSTTFYNLGRRELGVELYNEIMEVSPEAFISMMQSQLNTTETEDG